MLGNYFQRPSKGFANELIYLWFPQILQTPSFFYMRIKDGFRRASFASLATFKGVISTFKINREQKFSGYRATLKSAFTYFLIAYIWQGIEGESDATGLASAFTLGALLTPGLAPWLRLFPVTGDPHYRAWKRFLDLSVNMIFHLFAATLFVFFVKLCVSGIVSPMDRKFVVPNLYKGSIGLIMANYMRKLLTEWLGIRYFLQRHPLGPQLLEKWQYEKQEGLAHVRLRAWNELRELPGPGLIGLSYRGWGKQPRGYRSLIDESKMLDPALAGLFDHFLR